MSAPPSNSRPLALARLSLALGLAPLAVAALFTVTTAGAVFSGNAAFLESSRSLTWAFLALSLAGEALALAGLAVGAGAGWAGRRLAALPLAGLALNALMALLFLPASLSLALNAFFALLERLLR